MSNPEELELETADNEKALLDGEALERLRKNPDFKRVILEGYLTQSALNSVSVLSIPQMKNDRGSVIEDLLSISNLQYFFGMIDNFYKGAKNPVLSDSEEQDIAEREAAENEVNS